MAANRKSTGSRVVTLIFLAAVLLLLWMIAPWFFPVYRWLHVDFQQLAADFDVSQEELADKQRMTFYYNPRGKDDPLPWQIMVGNQPEPPSWAVYPGGEEVVEEFDMLVRVDLISDRTGESPSTFMKGGAYYDNFFEARAWRLPAGALGRTHTRPVVLVDGSTWKKLPISSGKPLARELKRDLNRGNWVTDDDPDLFPWREDDYLPPKLRPPDPEPEEDEESEESDSEE